MNDSERWKKEQESEELSYFLEKYEPLTGEELSLEPSERPDFVGTRQSGEPVGVELTAIVRHPEDALWDRILRNVYTMEGADAVATMWHLASRKSEKLKDPDWQCPDDTMLVFMFRDAEISESVYALDEDLQYEWAGLEFSEIWIADLSKLDAFGDAELFGLHPAKWWGWHRRPFTKPYG